jgi:hypothetical protein
VLDPVIVDRIRAIFLHHEHRVTPDAAAKMLGWTRAQMNEAIDAEEINVVGMCGGKTMIELRELASYVSYEWPIHVIEKALGREAALILPPGLRTRKLTVRLPLVHIQLLEVLASEAKQSVTKFLELEIEERAGNEKERLAGIIPGIVEAYYWPHEVPNQRVF